MPQTQQQQAAAPAATAADNRLSSRHNFCVLHTVPQSLHEASVGSEVKCSSNTMACLTLPPRSVPLLQTCYILCDAIVAAYIYDYELLH
jgi:hypothetical protein